MGRSQSRAGTLSQPSSRRSSASKREEQPGWRNEEKVEQKVERMLQYNSQPALRKIRLAPLVEVIEPTPPLCRNAPIFGMTGLDDQDFDFDISDRSSIHQREQNMQKKIKINLVKMEYFCLETI